MKKIYKVTPQDDKDKIILLRQEGKSYAEISKELNYSIATIGYHVSIATRERVKERNAENRRRITKTIQEIKEESGCIDCGGKFAHFILEFDHLPEYEKVASPTTLGSKLGLQAALDEIAKCDIVCANCHKARTWARAGYPE